MTLTLYYMKESPPCNTVLLTLELLKIKCEKKSVDLSKGEHLTGDLSELNPLCCVPTLVDGDLILWESRAICCYLVNEYAKNHQIYPAEPRQRAEIDKWLYFDATNLSPKQSKYLMPVLRKEKPNDEFKRSFFGTLKVLDQILEKNEYIASKSSYTLADLSLISSLLFSFANEENFDTYPSLCKWIEKMKSIPEYEQISSEALISFRDYMRELKN